jgi:ubiquinone/menaquinone biosynthesis C-methylase UbiE|tara:strand:+ start:565 stop:1143 length:579 start_codon:yes stop_codon:yes gene_type:complete
MTKWNKFFDEKIRQIARQKNVLDIGGGLPFQKGLAQYQDIFKNVNYQTLDINPQCNPDIVADIHQMSLESESVDAVICKAVLEHVHSPQKAVDEIYRILKKQGECLAYLPFLYPYHGRKDGYKDYYRYTKDGIEYLFRNFSSIETCPVRGNLETVINLIPLPGIKIFNPLVRILDRFFSFKQVSGYYVFLVK